MKGLCALAVFLALASCADPPLLALDATASDRVDAAAEAAAEQVPSWWSDAPVCQPPDDAGSFQEPDRSRCPALRFDPTAADPDAGMRACVPGRAEPCTCTDGRPGVEVCDFAGRTWGCSCGIVEAGSLWVREVQPRPPLPPRLIRPLSGMRVTSQRPMLRWVLPEGVTRTRVEVCADRPCTRVIERDETGGRGTSWRPSARLPPGVVFWRVQGLDAGGSVNWTSATWEFGVGRCDAAHDATLRTLRDFDGDSYDDAVMGFMESTVGVLWGRPVGHAPVLHSIGGAAEDLVGLSATLGDINGDGLADLGVGYPGYVRRTTTTGDTPFPNHRDVWAIYYGDRACGLRAEPARADRFMGPAICDLNGDGFGDVAANGRRGVGIFLGGPSGLAGAPEVELRFEEITAGFSTLRCDGDVDGDGYADVLVSDHGHNDGDGIAAVLYGAPDARIDRRTQRISSPSGGEFGHSARLTDLDGDGFSDVAIGSYGRFWTFRGTPTGIDVFGTVERRVGFSDGTSCGADVPQLRAGDMDGDGRGDVVANRCAAVSFFLSNGTPLVSNTPRWFVGSANGRDRIGSSMIPGDMNGDGWDDLLTSMWTRSSNPPFALNLHLLRGAGVEAPDWSWDVAMPPDLDLD